MLVAAMIITAVVVVASSVSAAPAPQRVVGLPGKFVYT